jgi:O-antigen ligase
MQQQSFVFVKLSTWWQQQLFRWLSFAIAFSIPFPVGINSTLSILLALVWLAALPKVFSKQTLAEVLKWSCVFVLALFGLLLTSNFSEAFFRIQQKVLLLLFPLVYFTVPVEWRKESKGIFASLILGVLLACVICLAVAFTRYNATGSNVFFFSRELVESTVVDLYPYVLAVLCLGSIVILAEHILSRGVLPDFFSTRSSMLAILFLAVMVLLLGVKQLWIALALLMAVYTMRSKSRKIYVALVVMFTCVAIAVGTFPVLKGRIVEALSEQSKGNPLDDSPETGKPLNGVALRRAIWVCAMDVVKENPLLGVGTGDGQDALQKAYLNRNFILAGKYNRFNAHNQYLQVAVNFGVIGLVVWLGTMVWLIRGHRQNWMLLSLMGMLLFSMLTESMLETNKGVLAFSFLTVMACWGFRSPVNSKM